MQGLGNCKPKFTFSNKYKKCSILSGIQNCINAFSSPNISRPLTCFEILGTEYPVAWRHTPKERKPHLHNCENFKPSEFKISNVFQLILRVHHGIKFRVLSGTGFSFDFVIITRSNHLRHVISKFNLTKLLVQSSLQSKKQLLSSRHSAAVGRQQPVGYELSAAIVSKTDRLHTCAADSRAKE
jgi:hypothetical protein